MKKHYIVQVGFGQKVSKIQIRVKYNEKKIGFG